MIPSPTPMVSGPENGGELCRLALRATKQLAYGIFTATQRRTIVGDVPAVLGYSVDEFCAFSAQAYEALVHPEDQSVILPQLRQAWTQPGNFDLSYRLRRKDGS